MGDAGYPMRFPSARGDVSGLNRTPCLLGSPCQVIAECRVTTEREGHARLGAEREFSARAVISRRRAYERCPLFPHVEIVLWRRRDPIEWLLAVTCRILSFSVQRGFQALADLGQVMGLNANVVFKALRHGHRHNATTQDNVVARWKNSKKNLRAATFRDIASVMSAIVSAISKAGGSAKLALALGITRQAVDQWKARVVPPEHVLAIEQITGVTRYELRPDIYGAPPTNPKQRASVRAA